MLKLVFYTILRCILHHDEIWIAGKP